MTRCFEAIKQCKMGVEALESTGMDEFVVGMVIILTINLIDDGQEVSVGG